MALLRYDDTDSQTLTDAQAKAAEALRTATAIAAAQPQPATAMPPGVGVGGAVGTSTRYALENHTHATSVQRAKLVVATAGTAVRWTFPKPYADGVVPVCTATAEIAAGATQPVVVNVVGTPTNAYVDFIVFRAQTQTLGATLLAVAGTVINAFGSAPTGVVLDCQAALPTQ